MSIEQSVIFCDYNTRLMDVPKSCFLPNKIGHKTTNMPKGGFKSEDTGELLHLHIPNHYPEQKI